MAKETTPPLMTTEPDRMDRLAELVEENARIFAQFQTGFAQSVAHYLAFDQQTQTYLRKLIELVENQAQAIAAVAQATARPTSPEPATSA